jgi:DnaJ-class molecular chaperone
MSNKDYYSILEIDKNASEEDIKKAYRKLALLHHPDRNTGNEKSSEKFNEISEAYSILGDKTKRNNYDSYGIIDNDQFGEDPFNNFNEIFKEHINNFMNMKYENDININNIFSNITGSSAGFPFSNIHVKVHTFPTDIFNSENIKDIDESSFDNPFSIFNKIFSKENISENISEKNINKNINQKIIYNKPETIVYNINVSLEDIYKFEKKKIFISRYRLKDGKKVKKSKNISIPIYCKEIFLEGEGHEFKDYNEKGDIIINIYNNINKDFIRINEYDVLTYKSINLIDIYNPFIYEIILPHGELIKIQSEKLTGKDHLIQKIIGKGIPYKNDNGNKSFGNLYVIYKVIFPDNLSEYNIYRNEETNIKDDLIVSYNCSINEIFSND